MNAWSVKSFGWEDKVPASGPLPFPDLIMAGDTVLLVEGFSLVDQSLWSTQADGICHHIPALPIGQIGERQA